ncbi:NYN domain-containing protein [Gordonia sihwensis]|uniref:NYN domain-containing protein n=1 Tax=Gordonia sihwensis TaxID=173559 RepID=UPI003D98EEC5
MRSTSCVYVDTGYLLSSAATRVTGTSLRSGINVDYPLLIDSLIRTADDLSGLPTLRTYWYDSATNGVPNTQQERIGELAKVKLRLGRFGMNGEQKGVDLRIGLDLVTHARNTASDVFFLVSGDDDLTEAVEEAQGHGVEVVVLAVPDSHGRPHGISRHLLRAADDMHVLDASLVDAAIIKIDRHPTAADAQNSDLSLPRLTDVPKPGPRPAPKPSPTPSTPPAEVPVSAPSASTTPAPSPLDVPRQRADILATCCRDSGIQLIDWSGKPRDAGIRCWRRRCSRAHRPARPAIVPRYRYQRRPWSAGGSSPLHPPRH